jgi:RimJ/RimL family protein N-acetyltransferase
VIPAPDPPLSDGVVTLRPWREDDVGDLVACLDGEEEVVRWLDAVPQPYLEDEARSWVAHSTTAWEEGSSAPFAVLDASSGELVGSVGFGWVGEREQRVGEIGYWMRVDARGRGLTTRAVRLVAGWSLRELGCERLQLRADERNLPSQRVAEKAGFRREGVLRSVHFNARQDRRVNFVMFSLLPGELDLDLPGQVV